MTPLILYDSIDDVIYDDALANNDVDYEYLRALKEERDAYDDFIASMDMDNDWNVLQAYQRLLMNTYPFPPTLFLYVIEKSGEIFGGIENDSYLCSKELYITEKGDEKSPMLLRIAQDS